MDFDLYLNVKTGQYILYGPGKGPGSDRPKKYLFVGKVTLPVV